MEWTRSFWLVICCAGFCPGIFAGVSHQEFEGEIRKTIRLKYALWLPEGYEAPASQKTRYPCILFLHGAGERGDKLDGLDALGPFGYARTHAQSFPFIVVAPLCPAGQQWQPESLIRLLDQLQTRWRVLTNAIYLTGYSMGGAGTWATAMEYPERFAAIAPISGRVIPLLAGRLWRTPVWVFHGEKDDVVPISQSREMVTLLQGLKNPQVRFTVLPGRGHEIWTEVYQDPALYAWFMEHRLP